MQSVWLIILGSGNTSIKGLEMILYGLVLLKTALGHLLARG